MKKPLTILFFFCIASVYSQNKIRFQRIGLKEGLSNQQVTCLYQDYQGFIWIGTSFGLNRFDGISCKTFYHNKSDSNSLVHNTVLSITEDAQHNLWIGTQEGVSSFNRYTEKFINYSPRHAGTQYFPKEHCYVFSDKRSTVWVGHNTGISFLTPGVKSFRHIPVQLEPAGGKRNRFVSSFLEDRKGRLWVSTSYGVKQVNRENYSIIDYSLDESGSGPLLNAGQQLVEDNKGRIFVGTWGAGILYYDESSDRFIRLLVVPDKQNWFINIVHALQPYSEQQTDFLLLGTESGLVKIKTDDLLHRASRIEHYVPDKLDDQTISNSFISHILIDKASNFWIATGNGISKIDPRDQRFQTLRVTDNINFEDNVRLMQPVFTNRNQYLLSTGLYHFLFDKEKLSFMPFSIQIDGRPPIYIHGMAKGKNYFWLATPNGLVQCNVNMKPVHHYQKGNDSNSLPTDRIYSVIEDHQGLVWIGTIHAGICVLDPSTGKIRRMLHDSLQPYDLSKSFVSEIKEDQRNNIWIGATNGLYQYKRKEKKFCKYRSGVKEINSESDNILCITETRDGKILAGSRQGVKYYDNVTDKLIDLRFNDEQVSDYVNGIIEDNNGSLWFATNNGLLQYNTQPENIRKFNGLNGLPGYDLTNAFYKDESGTIFIGFNGVLTAFDPAQMSSDTFAPAPVITGITIDNKPYGIMKSSPIEISYNQSISFDFVALNYSHSGGNQYAYKLGGIDKEWVLLKNNRTVRFSNLPAGKYTLQLKAANNDGIWNKQPTEFSFIVTPPFWKTWWFITLAVIVIAAGVYTLYRYRLNQLLRMEKLRTRIATDLHDDIGATLSSISFYSEAVKQKAREKLPEVGSILEKMGESSRRMVSSMSDIVWAINPDNDTAEQMIQRMHSYAAELCSLKNVELDFKADSSIGQIPLTLELRKNIYLVFKEAINNALKYSECSLLKITITKSYNGLSFRIIDNGKGFDSTTEYEGNGLKNMQNRATEIGGKVLIVSTKGEGTTIELNIKNHLNW